MTVAPVSIAKSSRVSLLLTPNVGAFTIFIFILPLVLFIARVAITGASTSATISKGTFFFITCSSID